MGELPDLEAHTSGRTHSAHFFELVDEPEEVAFVLESGMADRLLEAVSNLDALYCPDQD